MEDKGAFSFSTCWNIKRHTDGSSMLQEIRELGFRRVELNYNVTEAMLGAIEPMIERGEIGISSVHNTFPHVPDPDYGTDSVLLGFGDETKRQRAVELLVRSAEYAQRYGGEAVVVHPGEVPFPNDIAKELEQIYSGQGRDSEAYRSKWAELLERREAYSAGYVQTIIRSLDEVCNRAASKGINVRFGIETRSRPQQIPTLAEAKTVISALKGAPVGIWYDTGHAHNPVCIAQLIIFSAQHAAYPLPASLAVSRRWLSWISSGRQAAFSSYTLTCARSIIGK